VKEKEGVNSLLPLHLFYVERGGKNTVRKFKEPTKEGERGRKGGGPYVTFTLLLCSRGEGERRGKVTTPHRAKCSGKERGEKKKKTAPSSAPRPLHHQPLNFSSGRGRGKKRKKKKENANDHY